MTTYAVVEPNGQLDLLVINKNSTSALTGNFQLANYQPASSATIWQYGETQDTAQSQSSNGASALANFTTNPSVSGATFSYSFPAYSMTVLVLGKASPGTSGPTLTKTASAAPNPVTGTASVTVLPPSNGALSATAVFSVVSSWSTGFQASITITNTGTSPIANWIWQFNFAATITQIWNAIIVSPSGTPYPIADAGYNGTIAPGQSVTIGFDASPGHPSAGPSNYVLNGVMLG